MKAQGKLLFLLCLFFLTRNAAAQRPKVGLVLSGGGAKGLAHIGILKAIDSAGLKIDYITGTSMGSIMGAMYAVGYSGKQIDSIGKTLDWDVLLSNKPAFREISYDEKDEYARYAVEVGIRDFKPQIGTGLIESEELWLKFSEVFFPVYQIKDFNKFNIPFKCVATDLATGKAVVHSKGELISALRSSMAIPSIFSAVELEGAKLVDGGIVRNFPVSDAKNMGADIIIGVNLFPGLTKIEDLNTALDIMYQITQYRDAEDLIKEKKLCNLIIEPSVDNYSAGSFGASDTIKQIGEETGQKFYPYFKKLADSLNALYPVKYDPYARLPQKDSVTIVNYEIQGLSKTSRTMLINSLNIRPGKKYNAFQLNDGFRKAYSSRFYNKIIYFLKPSGKDSATLKCELNENPSTSLKLGLSYHSYTGAGIIFNITERNLLFDKSRTMIKLMLGENFRALIQHKQAFGKQLSDFITLGYSYESLPLPIYNPDKLSEQKYLYRINLNLTDINYKHVYWTDRSFGGGVSYYHYILSPGISANGSYKGDLMSYLGYVNYESNTIDRRFFPRSGYDISLEAGMFFNRKFDMMYANGDSVVDVSNSLSVEPVEKVRISFAGFHKLSSRLTLIDVMQGGIQKTKTSTLPIDAFMIGGIQPVVRNQFTFPGLLEGQILSPSFAGLTLGLQYKLINELYLIGRVSGGVYDFTTLQKWIDPDKARGLLGSSLSLGYNLGAMPMEFSFMYSPQVDKPYGHVRIGFMF